MYTATATTDKLLKMRKRIRAVAGGTSAGKTISILTILLDDAMTDTVPTLTSVVSESYPHLRRGVMRDFMAIMQQHHYWKDSAWNKTESIYTLPNGSKIEFFSADQPGKVRGPRRDRLFINEANNIPYEAYDQLAVRTKEYIWLDWNPTNEFWFYTDVQPVRDDIDFVTVTYKDNGALSENIVKDIEAHKPNKSWWQVYGLGLLGEVEGRIFTDWAIIDEVPHEAKLEVAGMDFGYAADPTVLVNIYYYNGGYIVDEQIYATHMLDTEVGNRVKNSSTPNTLIIGDSADVQKIQMLSDMGLNIIGVVKRGAGGDVFTRSAIGFVQDQRMSITKRSAGVIKSYRNFMWKYDKDGNQLSPAKYDHYLSDGMMAVIYGMTNFDTRRREQESAEPYVTGNITSLWG